MHAAFVILVTFVTSHPGSHDALKTIRCRDQACVERVIAAAEQSTRLARLRVFAGDPGDLGNGATVQAPLQDLWLQ